MKDALSPFHVDAVAPETAAFNARLAAELAEAPTPMDVDLALLRAARNAGQGIFPAGGPSTDAAWQQIAGPEAGPRQVRLLRPKGTASGRYLHIHGGGWSIGRPENSDFANQRVADLAGVEVASVAYRLAPEHPWPAAGDDCEAAALWALEGAPGPVVIGGESAGAHLAAMTLMRLKARGLIDRVAGAVLTYGMYDMRLTPSARAWGAGYLVLSTPVIEWFAGNLLNGWDPADPGVSPLLADLRGMPPALFQIGTADPLLDDTLFMAARWEAAGGRAELSVVPGGVHAFDAFDLEIARAEEARKIAFVRSLCAS